MEILTKVEQVRKMLQKDRKEGRRIGFVPTMGYLHKGHVSLIERAKSENDKVIVSVFVNPTQFGPNEDLAKYPRDFDGDVNICRDAGVDYIFHPQEKEMYLDESFTKISVEGITTKMCGKSRIGHFEGVCTVVAKLFNIMTPDKAYFGQKDFQQLMVIKKMVQDLNFKVDIIACPTIREEDGLAMSSRNVYLTTGQRKSATVLSRSLKLAESMIQTAQYPIEKIITEVRNEIMIEKEAEIEYIEVLDSETLKDIDFKTQSIVIAIAVHIGKIRLIDNTIIKLCRQDNGLG